MPEIKVAKICNNCLEKYASEIPHYCNKCGNNLSDRIELSDFYSFLSTIFLILFVLGLLSVPGVSIIILLLFETSSAIIWLIPIAFLALHLHFKYLYKKRILENLKK